MKPQTASQEKRAWITLAATLVLSLIILGIPWCQRGGKQQVQQAEIEHQRRLGPRPLVQQVEEHRDIIGETQEQIDELKTIMGMARLAPFLKPERDSGGYIAFLIRFLHQELQLKAQHFPVEQRLGFPLESTLPPSEDAADAWLSMLQLVTKALFLCTETPDRGVDEVVVTRVTISPIETGPQNRPALLREYAFSLRVTASLESISWLLLQFSSDPRTPGNKDEDLTDWLRMIERGVEAGGYRVVRPSHEQGSSPLIVRGFNIIGSRLEEQRASRLSVTFDLAGMEFLSDEERGETDPIAELRRRRSTQRSPVSRAARY